MKWPGSFSASRCPPIYAPRGKMLWPNTCTAARWHSTGSPTCAVAEEKLGSLMVQRRSVPAGTTASCAREVGESSKDKVDARKTTNREVLRRMVFLPRTVRAAGGHIRGMDWTQAGRSKSCLNQKDVQRAKSTLMRKPKQEQIQRGNFAFWRDVFGKIPARQASSNAVFSSKHPGSACRLRQNIPFSNSPDPQPLHEREYQSTGFSLSKCPEVVRSRPGLETGARVPGRKQIG